MNEHRFIISGEDYHEKKPKFHALLKKYNFRWKGKLNDFRWHGIGQIVTAKFERDDDVTKRATIVWTGLNDTMFLEELKELIG